MYYRRRFRARRRYVRRRYARKYRRSFARKRFGARRVKFTGRQRRWRYIRGLYPKARSYAGPPGYSYSDKYHGWLSAAMAAALGGGLAYGRYKIDRHLNGLLPWRNPNQIIPPPIMRHPGQMQGVIPPPYNLRGRPFEEGFPLALMKREAIPPMRYKRVYGRNHAFRLFDTKTNKLVTQA